VLLEVCERRELQCFGQAGHVEVGEAGGHGGAEFGAKCWGKEVGVNVDSQGGLMGGEVHVNGGT